MTDLIESTLRLGGQLPGRTSRPGDDRYAAATAIWAKPVGLMPRMVVHCRTMADIQFAIAAARSAGLALSVRGSGHDWAGRALCDGLVLDLSSMRDVHVSPDRRSARISATTPKFPPPPRRAQNKSSSLPGSAVTIRPSARTMSAAIRLSSARPKRPINGP